MGSSRPDDAVPVLRLGLSSRIVSLFAMGLLLVAPCVAFGAIAPQGDVSPPYPVSAPDPWDLGESELRIGDSSNGLLSIGAGSGITSSSAVLGNASGVLGQFELSGAGSTWSNSGDLHLGVNGAGELAIRGGTLLSGANSFLGASSGTGTVLVEGNGSTWLNAGDMIIGDVGQGNMTIRDRGSVVAGAAQIARGATSTGVVLVDGEKSSWTAYSELRLGSSSNGGSAMLSLTGAGSRVYVGTAAVFQGDLLPLTETALIVEESFGGSELAIHGGSRIQNTGNAYIAVGENKSGKATVDGATSSWHNGGDVLVGTGGVGTLVLKSDGTVSAGGTLTIGEFGTLTGDGVASGNLLNSGVVSPGESIGNLAIVGDYSQASLGTLRVELGGASAGAFDTLMVDGEATLEGTLEVNLYDGQGGPFAPMLGDSFEIVTADDITGKFTHLQLPALPDDLVWKVLYGSTSISLTVANADLLGDYNDNGTVDAADYTIWRDTLGSTSDLRADGDNSGDITAIDFGVWKDNFSPAATGGAALASGFVVPEPPHSLLAVSLLPLLACWGRVRGYRVPH